MPSVLPPLAPTAAASNAGAGASAGGPSAAGGSSDPVRQSVGQLLIRAYALPCSTAAQAFSQILQPVSRFQLALDALLPLLDPAVQCELEQRILVSFILYSLYAPYPITLNPFKSVLFTTFTREREAAKEVAERGQVAENEQLVWVLWKILKGDGNDIGPYSPSTLARSPLPPKLRASNLLLDQDLYNSDLDDNTTSDTTTRGRQGSPLPTTKYVTSEEDAQRENMAQAMKILLAAKERALTLSEQRVISPMINQLASSQMVTPLDIAPIVAYNPVLAHPLFVALLTGSGSGSGHAGLPTMFLDIIPYLPPTLPTFDLLGRLLRDPTPTASGQAVGDLVRAEVLGRFVSESVRWLEDAEREEREGSVSDDRFAKGVQNLCRFYHSLVKLGIVDPADDAETAEMAHFSLRHARFEEANALYRALATGRF